jgi:hypothetical protein
VNSKKEKSNGKEERCMAVKVNIACSECEATATVKHDLDEEVYTVSNCPFCGAEIIDDSDLDIEDDQNEDFEV